MELYNAISTALQEGDDEQVGQLTREALDKGLAAKEILSEGLIKGMDVIGAQFKKHEIFLPDVLMAAKAMNAGMQQIKPLLEAQGIHGIGKVVIGSVHGDLHDIGKNLVAIMLRGAGFEVIDLGKDVPPEKFVETAKNEKASVIGMSALLTTTMPAMKRVIELLKENGLENSVKTIVGGAPLSEEVAKEIGADAYGFDAAKAVDCVKQLTL